MDGFKGVCHKMYDILVNWFTLLPGNIYILTQIFNTTLNTIDK